MAKKIILVDGNNLIFRSYYATAYSGNMMKNSKGFPTNALYGFVAMINKIIETEKPIYMAVAFDVGKNFRTEKYKNYKEGRITMPNELKQQMPIARDILRAMGIKYFELEPYEADDIIGTFAKMADLNPEYDATIISSDKDLLQLITDVVDVKLLKQKDFIRYNPKTFYEDFGIAPINIIDLKALAGDSSDNIPGVKGIGEKTALNLLQEYKSLENIYEHINDIKGKIKEKLLIDKEIAFLSKEIATIYKDVPLDIDLDAIKKEEVNNDLLRAIYEELEFYSLMKNMNQKDQPKEKIKYKLVKNVTDIKDSDVFAFYIESDSLNYHKSNILGMSLSAKNGDYFIPLDLIIPVLERIKGKILYTFDAKKNKVLLKRKEYDLISVNFDMMIAAYLLNYNLTDDIAYLMKPKGREIPFYEQLLKINFADEDELREVMVWKSKFILENKDVFMKELQLEDMERLFLDIEMPLIDVLADMEINGVRLDLNILNEMKEETKIKIELVSNEIYNNVGMQFNISSPKQLGDILFDKLNLPYGKKTKSGKYKTDVKVLHKLRGTHPVIERILEYRNLTKLNTTYLEGVANCVHGDGKIHTIYRQNLTRTGRLSSVEPNMQNIPTKDEEGRKVRQAFLPSDGCIFMSVDYSQIELRILAHISNSEHLIRAFKNEEDIHTKVAMDIFEVNEQAVTKNMRKAAKAVVFGIVYGISGFGLGENLEIPVPDAKKFIDKFLELYPKVKDYMEAIVKQAYNDGCVRTLFNRKRNIDELNNTNFMIRQAGERIALNTPIQGTNADIIKKAMCEIFEAFKKENIKSKMILQVHDELIFDIYKDEKEKVTKIVKDIMENTISLKVPIKVNIDYGKNWYEAK